ncbi:glycosyltransferase family 4 protein [Frigoribacterium sp. PhB24]|uniref:glycosyltransferase family 4 protein n=1 Tax=Frigoribacterium sp. PhB24 TaxID=2485204 RepID=UPI0013151933|nr:glycosyltransferase family 4 protein [Frigoribacterium sp. PhB24]
MIFYVREMSWFVAAGRLSCPAIVDVDDFAEVVLDRWLDVNKNDRGDSIGRLEAGRMRRRSALLRRQHLIVARSGARRLVVSAADARRVPGANADIVPNAYPPTTEPGGVPLHERRNVLLFVGMHLYAPNDDAARWFVQAVLPLVVDHIPDAEFRIVGRANDRLFALNSNPNVTVTGPVDDVKDELSMARAVVVPLRVGGGSRIKILEAMASEVPVVSTTIGAEGLEVRPGTHALIADTPGELAEACVRALRLGADVTNMVEAGARLARQHSPEVIARRVQDIAAEVGRPAER